MKLGIIIGTILAATVGSLPAQAQLIHDFELNGSLADSIGTSILAETDPLSGSLGATGYSFARNQGLTLAATDVAGASNYSVELFFTFAEAAGYRRILDFKDGTSDTGLYDLSTSLKFFNVAAGPGGTIATDTPVHVVFTRDGFGTATGYVDGVSQFSFSDTSGIATIGNLLTFFRDDGAVANEASAGFVDAIRIYGSALSADQVAALPGPMAAVPEPASWAMMIGGFGLLGATLRRRCAATLRYA